MSYRVQQELDEQSPIKERVLLHKKFLAHFHKRKLDGRGRTAWSMEFVSSRGGFTIIWTRQPGEPGVGSISKFRRERLMGFVVVKFSAREVEMCGSLLIGAEWDAIEDIILRRESRV